MGSIPFTVLPFDAAVDEVIRRSHVGQTHRGPLRERLHDRPGGQGPAVREPFEAPEALNLTDGMPVAWVGRRAYSRTASSGRGSTDPM